MDAERFTNALKPHLDDALNYCRALCVNQSNEEAEDILQTALLKAYRGFSKLKKTDSFKSWLFKIITNCFYTQTRLQFWKRFIPLDGTNSEFPEVYSESKELNLSMRYALMRLSKKERVAILLYEVGGFNVTQIAEFQGENSNSAVKSRLSRSRQKMKQYLTDSFRSSASNRYLTSNKLLGDLQYETIQMAEEINIKE